jgi:hypothetical protein
MAWNLKHLMAAPLKPPQTQRNNVRVCNPIMHLASKKSHKISSQTIFIYKFSKNILTSKNSLFWDMTRTEVGIHL